MVSSGFAALITPEWVVVVTTYMGGSCGPSKEGPYQDRPLLYPFHHNPSLLGSCSSPGSA